MGEQRTMNPKVSICIPAYQRLENLEVLLNSIEDQTFRDFEVIITDDSPDNSVQDFLTQNAYDFEIKYHHNAIALGNPANWNSAMQLAQGEWIKMMHDDDLFSRNDALAIFVEAAEKTDVPFIFSNYSRINVENGNINDDVLPDARFEFLSDNPFLLLANNIIGPPSTVFIHRSLLNVFYDVMLKWFVDIDYYIQILREHRYFRIDAKLIYIGISPTQVTSYAFNNPKIQIPELNRLLMKYGTSPMKNSIVYDAWWRFIRNMRIRGLKDWVQYGGCENPPKFLRSIIKAQCFVPHFMLRWGPLSKLGMYLNYSKNKSSL